MKVNYNRGEKDHGLYLRSYTKEKFIISGTNATACQQTEISITFC